MKIMINKNMCVFCMWNKDNKFRIKYSKSDDINESSFINIIRITKRILISGGLAFFATVVGKVNMSSCWCHWCN